MIDVDPQPDLITATVFGEFTLSDYEEFEAAALDALDAKQRPNLLFDLTQMSGYTVDVVWEEVRFGRRHERDFAKMAVVTRDQWAIWSAWLTQLFVDTDVEVFEDKAAALEWLA